MAGTYKFDMASKRISRDSTVDEPDAMFADLTSDTLYVVDGTEVRPVHGGVSAAGVWRSRVVKAPSGVPTGFAWLRANGQLAPGVVAKLFADGVPVYTSSSITDGEPRRLPAVMARAWEIELTGAARVTSLVVTDNTEDLL